MRVLVAYASKYGATKEIAEAIANQLSACGHEANLADVEQVTQPGRHDAFVLGSAIYMGHWMREMRDFINANRVTVAEQPTWLFSSGPVGDDESPKIGEPVETNELVEATLARGYRSFAGRLDPAQHGLKDRLVLRVVHAQSGDFRDWESIRDWARDIDAELRELTAEAATL